jgi:transposase
MRLPTLLPHLAGLRLARADDFPDELLLELVPDATTARCPVCRRRSRHRHSRYTRKIADHPLGDRRVTIHLQVRRFRCRVPSCPQQTFAEQQPRLVARYARRSVPLQALLQDIGLTLGGRPGARFAARRAIAVGRTTLLRLVRALPEPPVTAPPVLGVDDFALRRGHRYGTILVDLAAHQVIDLRADRTADTLAGWLREHGQPEVICRDRGGDYASGARQGAPDAIQIADRFHLVRNSSEVLERVLARHRAALQAAVADGGPPPPTGTEPAPPPAAPATPNPRRERRLARYEQVIALRREGRSIAAIAAALGLSRPTVRTYVRAGEFPEWSARRTKLGAGTAHGTRLRARWNAGCRDATLLWQDLRARGFTGSLRMVQRAVAGWRVEPGRRGRAAKRVGVVPRPAPPRPRPPSPRQAVWLLLRPVDVLEPTQRTMRDRLLAAAPEVERALAAIVAFRRMVRQRAAAALDDWLAAAVSGVPELRAFAASLRRDLPAIMAALTHAWSSAQVEGQVTRTKVIKRQMYGRAKFDLLRKRVLLAS